MGLNRSSQSGLCGTGRNPLPNDPRNSEVSVGGNDGGPGWTPEAAIIAGVLASGRRSVVEFLGVVMTTSPGRVVPDEYAGLR